MSVSENIYILERMIRKKENFLLNSGIMKIQKIKEIGEEIELLKILLEKEV